MDRFSPARTGPGVLAPALVAALLLSPGVAVYGADNPKTDSAKKDEPKTEYKTPATPRDAMIQATEGLFKGNEDQLFKAARFDDKQKAFARAAMRFIQNVFEFRAAFIKTYGEKAWARFIDPNIDPGMGEGNTNLTITEMKDQLGAIKEAKIEEKGDEATAEFKDKKDNVTKWKLHKVKDGWLVDGESLTVPADKLEMTTKQLGAIADLLKKYKKAIGKPGISGDDIDVELGKAILKELTGFKSDKKPRFDIDAIKD